jgi:hypothetical protein
VCNIFCGFLFGLSSAKKMKKITKTIRMKIVSASKFEKLRFSSKLIFVSLPLLKTFSPKSWRIL